MKTNKQNLYPWLFLFASIIFIVGIIASIVIFKSPGLKMYPSMISNTYREQQHHLSLPGKTEVFLTRTGAYGIYYEYSLVAASAEDYTNLPPDIQCSLTSHATDSIIQAVPDYVESNRYWSKEAGGIGVLVMSISVDEPGKYAFECSYKDGQTEPEIRILLGPNYYWEFLRVIGTIFVPFVFGINTIFVSITIPFFLVIIGVILKKAKHNYQ
ncbi:hypothetical protein JR338_04440 [Chloroflexota bacterium]|nr:hypothetical protein JR338_04440 [Chloroflexota bacterium]